VNIVVIAVKPVVRTFVLHPQENEYSTRDADRETKQIGEREALVAKQVSPCNLDIVFKHKKVQLFQNPMHHSVRKLFTGLVSAALMA
jgi:hypothetical protein